jgi:hypothetical protein
MTQFGDTLTTTGVIATIISTLFAVASLIIARRRKHHDVVPPPHEQPQPEALPAATEQQPLNTETRATSSPLFKRLGRVGIESTAADSGRDNQMSWE